MTSSSSAPSALPRAVALGLIGGVVVAYFFVPAFAAEIDVAWTYAADGDTDALASWFARYGWWGPVVVVSFFVLQMFLLFFPTWIPMVVAVIGYGPLWGSFISLAGVLAAGVVGYRIGAGGGRRTLARVLGPERHARLTTWLDGYGFAGVALFRLSPLLSTDAVSFAAGAAGMPMRRYLLATVLGTLPLLAIIAYFGRDVSGLKTGMWWAGGLGLVAFSTYAYLKRRKTTARTAAEASDDTAGVPGVEERAGELVT